MRHTAVGGPEKAKGPHKPGAVQLGYVVLTSHWVLRGGDPDWWNEPGVRFYQYI